MAGNMYAIEIMLVVVGTILVLVRYGKSPTRVMPVITGFTCGIFVFFLGIIFNTRMMGVPISQILLLSLCFTTTLLFLRYNKLWWLPVTSLLIIMLMLGLQFSTLAHTPGIVGAFNQLKYEKHITEKFMIEKTQDIFRDKIRQEPEVGEKVFPAGEIRRCGMLTVLTPAEYDTLAPVGCSFTSTAIMTSPYWHTQLTDLCVRSDIPLVLYYPGGKLRDGIGRLAYLPVTR